MDWISSRIVDLLLGRNAENAATLFTVMKQRRTLSFLDHLRDRAGSEIKAA